MLKHPNQTSFLSYDPALESLNLFLGYDGSGIPSNSVIVTELEALQLTLTHRLSLSQYEELGSGPAFAEALAGYLSIDAGLVSALDPGNQAAVVLPRGRQVL